MPTNLRSARRLWEPLRALPSAPDPDIAFQATARRRACPAAGIETFFLWGPRQTGKSTLLRKTYPDARWIDLLKADDFRRYAARPELLRQELDADAVGDARGAAPASRSRPSSTSPTWAW